MKDLLKFFIGATLLISIASGALATLDNGLVGYWNFDSKSGDTAVDYTEYENNGSINGATRSKGYIESALEFDGSNDYVKIPMSSSLDFSGKSAVTVTAWIKPHTWDSENSGIVDQEAEDSWILREENGIIEFLIQDSNGNWHQNCGFSRPSTDTWNLVTGKYNSSGIYVYLNDTLRAGPETDSDCDIGARTINGGGTDGTLIGRNRPDNTRFFDGQIDEVRIYDRALSETEIEDLYNYRPEICDKRGAKNECILDADQKLDSKTYQISSIFLSEITASIEALNGQATLEVSNSTRLSGLWTGSFFFQTPNPVLEPGLEMRPKNGNIVVGEN